MPNISPRFVAHEFTKYFLALRIVFDVQVGKPVDILVDIRCHYVCLVFGEYGVPGATKHSATSPDENTFLFH